MLYDDRIALDDATLFEQIVLRRRSNGDKAYKNFDKWFDHAQRWHGQMREWQAVLSSGEFRASAVALAQQPTQAAFVDVMHTMNSLPRDFPINPIWEELCKHIPGVHIGIPPGDVSMILYVTMESAKEMLPRHSPMSPMAVREVLACVLVLVRIARASGLDNAYKQVMNEAEDDEEEAKQDDEDRDDNDVDKEGVEEDEDEEHVDGGTNGGDERSTLHATMAGNMELRAEIISLRRRLGTLEPKRSRSQPKRSRSRSRSRSQSRSRPLEFMRSE